MARTVLIAWWVSVLVFGALRLTPGNPALLLLGPQARVPGVAQHLKALERQMGLGRPVLVQYWLWLKPLLEGNLGKSDLSGRPVFSLISLAAPPTLWLIALSVLVAVPVSIGLGVLAARFRSSWIDRAVRLVAALALATPAFWLGLILLLLFAVDWHLLPATGYVPPGTSPSGFVSHMAMPVAALSLYLVGVLTRYVYTEVSVALGADFVRTARAMGVGEPRVLFVNATRNALIPMVSVVGASLGPLVGGAVIVEQVFGLGGLGELLYNSVIDEDYAVVQGIVLLLTLGIIVVQGMADLTYRRLDPRIV
ncbi:MAG TPA: ABC transporter permease [Acidimicrobiales bacterium]|nr:ABC transporter permease [Acidimicrobiales bacterium]